MDDDINLGRVRFVRAEYLSSAHCISLRQVVLQELDDWPLVPRSLLRAGTGGGSDLPMGTHLLRNTAEGFLHVPPCRVARSARSAAGRPPDHLLKYVTDPLAIRQGKSTRTRRRLEADLAG